MNRRVLQAEPVNPLSRVTINIPNWPAGLLWKAMSLLVGTGSAWLEETGEVEQPASSTEESASNPIKRIVSLSIRDSK